MKEEDPADGKAMFDGLAVTVKSGDWGLKNSVIVFALASFEVRLARFQFDSIVFVNE